MSENEDIHELGEFQIPSKLLESSGAAFKDRSKRRLSLPLSGVRPDSRKSSLASSKGGGGVDNDDRRTSFSSTDSWTTDDSSFDEDLPHPRERKQINSSGFTEFCVKNINNHEFGRRELELAEMEMPGLINLR